MIVYYFREIPRFLGSSVLLVGGASSEAARFSLDKFAT